MRPKSFSGTVLDGRTLTKVLQTMVIIGLAVVLSWGAFAAGQGEKSAGTRKITAGCLWPFDDAANRTPMYVLNMLSQEYVKSHPGVTVQFQLVANEYVAYEQQMNVLAASHSLPDLFQYQVSTGMASLYDHGYIVDMEKTFKDLGIWDQLHPAAVALVRTGDAKGRLTSLPMMFNAHGLIINDGMFQQYGWTYPKTWDELYTLCGKILAQGIQPLAMNGKDGWNMTTFMHNYIMRKAGIKATENASYGKEGVKFTDPAFIEAAQMMAKFGQAGYFGKGLTTVDWSGAHDMFHQGQAAMWPETTGAAGDLDSPQINKLGIKASLHPYPEVAGGVAPNVQDGYAEANTSIGEVISTGRMDATFADYLKYVFSRYGNAELKVAGSLPGFVVTDTSSVPPFLALATSYLQSRKETTLWFEAKLPPRGVEYSFRNIALLSLGQLSAQDFMGNIQQAVDDSLASK